MKTWNSFLTCLALSLAFTTHECIAQPESSVRFRRTHLRAIDTIALPFDCDFRDDDPLSCHVGYNPVLQVIEISDRGSRVVLLDTNGNLLQIGTVKYPPDYTGFHADTDLLAQYTAIGGRHNVISSVLRMYGSVDTVIDGDTTTSDGEYDQVIRYDDSLRPVIINPAFGHFSRASSDGHDLWTFDDKSALQLRTFASILHVNLSSRTLDTVTVALNTKSIPARYYTTCIRNDLFIFPDSGDMIRIDSMGRIKRTPLRFQPPPGYRHQTFCSGDKRIGTIRDIDDMRAAVFYDLNGEQVAGPFLLPPPPSFALLLDSGLFLIFARDANTAQIMLYRSKVE